MYILLSTSLFFTYQALIETAERDTITACSAARREQEWIGVRI